MRGSVYYQTSVLVKTIFKEGVKKYDRTDPSDDNYQSIASFNSMDTYRSVWNNFFNYLKEQWKLKNCELITSEHVEAYLEYKIEYYPTRSYAKKLSSAINCLERALNKYSNSKYDNPIVYDFSIRKEILNNARNLGKIANNYVNRAYKNPLDIINSLESNTHKLAASIQLQGGARSEGVTLINYNQLKGYCDDKISGRRIGVITTKEKGGKVGDVLITAVLYSELERYFFDNDKKPFKIIYQKYADDIKKTCKRIGVIPRGSHGLRWTFAQNRVKEYQNNGYSYNQAIQGTSWEMKHFRANITEHYLGS